MSERFPGTHERPECSSEIDEEFLNNKRRISSEPSDSQAESQQTADPVDQELGCGICLETLTVPYTIIPCLHTFDQACLVEWWKRNSNCPTCKKTSTSAKSAFQLNAILDHIHKNRLKRRKLSPPPTSNEIFPLSGVHLSPEYYDGDLDSDEQGSGGSYLELTVPGDGLIWPCDACAPNNQTGYTCPTPLPSPTPADIQAAQAHSPVMAPVRGNRRTPLDFAVENGIPGASDHSLCIACGTYVPLGFPRAIKCGGCSEIYCNNFDPSGCPSPMPFYPRHDVKLAPHTAFGLSFHLQPQLRSNRHEVSRLTDYITTRHLSLTDILVALFEAKRYQAADDTNEDVANERWGPDAWFCNRCVTSVTSSMLFDWWVRERSDSLQRQDGIIVTKLDCWYGRECRTQGHNDSHAERYNHICENIRRTDL